MKGFQAKFRLWPQNLGGQATVLLLISLTVFHLGSLWMHQHDLEDSGAVASTTVMAVGIIIVSVLLVRWITGPLRRLAQAADAIGRGSRVTMPQDGPEEVQRLAQALDAMQARIERMVDERTQALAAVSHDLRTPITRLRLRAGFLDDVQMQGRMEADLNEMEAMIDATLAYLQGDLETETPQLTDMGAMLSTLCDASTDAGEIAEFEGPRHFDALCRPVALRRAVANLIGNAIAYGGGATVRLGSNSDALRITVEDSGPGIPEDDLARVFEPFQRLETSRNRASGGVGLGLTIARQAIVEQGGTLTLTNRSPNGLLAVIALPKAHPAVLAGPHEET